MELVSKGCKHPDVVYEGTCRTCWSTFTCERRELNNIEISKTDWPNDSSWEVCPECGSGSTAYYKGILFRLEV